MPGPPAGPGGRVWHQGFGIAEISGAEFFPALWPSFRCRQ